MSFYKLVALSWLAAILGANQAAAGVYGDDMTKCIVKSTTPEDQTNFVRWIYTAMSAYPDFKVSSKLSAEQSEAVSKSTADIMTRLLTVDCKKEVLEVLKYEGEGAIGPAFKVVGEIAMRRLMGDPDVNAFVAGIAQYIRPEDFEAMRLEAGLPPSTRSAPK